MLDMHELIRQMERAERMWPDDRPWAIHLLASYLHISPAELLSLFKQINPLLESEKDQVMPEDLRLLRAHCERLLERTTPESIEEKRKEQARARERIRKLLPEISKAIAEKRNEYALNTYKYMLGEAGEVATPEEKAQWYEEMGRLCLKTKRHANEAALYFRSAVHALSLLEDAEGIDDLLSTYDEDFQGDDARRLWETVVTIGRESISRISSFA